MRRVRGQRTTDSFKRLLLCIFSRTGRNFTRICEVLPNEYTPQWIAARIGPHGHGSLLGDDVWYAVYWDYSDLPSDTWKQTARSLWLAMLSVLLLSVEHCSSALWTHDLHRLCREDQPVPTGSYCFRCCQHPQEPRCSGCCGRISAVGRGSYCRRDTGSSRSCNILSGIHNKTTDESGCHVTGQIASLHAPVATGSSW